MKILRKSYVLFLSIMLISFSIFSCVKNSYENIDTCYPPCYIASDNNKCVVSTSGELTAEMKDKIEAILRASALSGNEAIEIEFTD